MLVFMQYISPVYNKINNKMEVDFKSILISKLNSLIKSNLALTIVSIKYLIFKLKHSNQYNTRNNDHSFV